MGLEGYWEANLKSLADFVSKDNLKALLELYLKNGPLAGTAKSRDFWQKSQVGS